MDKVANDHSCLEERLARVLSALGTGAILLDSNREIAWMDERTRARLNGGIEQLAATLRGLDPGLGVHCCLHVQELMINGEAATLCLIREYEPLQDVQGYDAIAAVEAAMTDASWFTRAFIEKLKAFRPTKRAVPRLSDLDILSDRECEVLGLICEGRSDAQMGTMLNLSQNTIRNHIASLYRKIGVNRRSAAIIWARERGVTSHDALPPRRLRPPRRNAPQE
ncbi:LuxR C-terminal-related transcriptional regulator [Bradyrhizobium sp. ISRA443]|uniref:helix-turn-helix transcriptional regulator n=1 Tax=unclassified Bradyrhizobium TaxID=2631580 RepID=UPI00247A0709|nr:MULTISPECIES: LuxR C-terminal-related transcriptional regulator [unclassified Bradyrhizobium]WGR94009.1 LuxR C-terminal-related transcriptional regulator [Bradyrhizobium sp. ISRA435]WGR98637.1 LuxR C-terminal-related transcriptional regulator [Bradyrhizobium sp. ISRA436]WGS05526.1 LuxR C-terminal-related transcriptional regulator [Bradyrhizobium sp. ISRA437]WGS12413.1 LuxR C-terminal-related transcriptional regulator [Bradyrhizobium sp. ISRA443]